jgi:hypothetical protein
MYKRIKFLQRFKEKKNNQLGLTVSTAIHPGIAIVQTPLQVHIQPIFVFQVRVYQKSLIHP